MMPVKGKERVDRLLVKLGLAESHEKAAAMILTGKVLAAGTVVDKAGRLVADDAEITILPGIPYVSRGGFKLVGVLNYFSIDVKGLTVMDVGASTGGFTDCLLKMGAGKVFAVDVGKGILDWRLRNDKRVVVMEERNIRYLEFKDIGERLDMAVIDVSFISLEKVIDRIRIFSEGLGFIVKGICESAIRGAKGNTEFWIYLENPAI